jgi:hypothetical protein
MVTDSSRHSSSHDLVENILDSGLPSDEVALHVGCEEIVALAQDFRNLFEQLEAERRDRKWWAAASSRERQRLLERYAEAVGYIRSHLAGNDADPELRWVVDQYEEDPVTKPANLPITEERPRDAGTSGATT